MVKAVVGRWFLSVDLRSVQVQYREEVGRGTAVMDTPEMERVRRNQENISSVRRHTHTPSYTITHTLTKERRRTED